MQVDCYKRNYNTEVCSDKCSFRVECDRCYKREMINYDRQILSSSVRDRNAVNRGHV